MLQRLWTAIWKYLYWPICRVYARYCVGDRPADLNMRLLCGLFFIKTHRYWPHFAHPRSFIEKIWARMLFERDPAWTLFSDKLRVREYVASRAGEHVLVPLLWSGEDPSAIPFDRLPQKFVIKANHGCDYNILVRDKTRLHQREVRRRLTAWLGTNYCQDCALGVSWGYKHVQPAIMVESFLEENGQVPPDYKFFCYDGRMEFLKIDFNRFENHSEAFFDREMNRLSFYGKGISPYDQEVRLPDNFQEMVRVAEALSAGIDFIRVDLYSVSGRIYFGELTCYHGGGMISLCPREYDDLLGKDWHYVRSSHALASKSATAISSVR